MNARGIAGAAAGIVLALALQGGGSSAVAQDPVPEATVLEVSAVPARDDLGREKTGEYWITASLTTASGRYLADRRIDIVEPVEFFGQRDASLGTAATDGTGQAAVPYRPVAPGTHVVIARYAGSRSYAPAEATLALAVTEVNPPFQRAPAPLADIGQWLSVALAALGVAFWTVLVGVIGRTIRGLRAAAGSEMAGDAPAVG